MLRGSTVLVVDDDASLRQLLEMTLGAAGYTVLTAADGFEALAVVRERSPEVVLLDWMMPGCDGGTICRLVKDSEIGARVAVVMMSCDERLTERAKEFGADAYFLKPFDIGHVLSCVQTALSRPPGVSATNGNAVCASLAGY